MGKGLPLIVLDASVLVELLIGNPSVSLVWERLQCEGGEIHAPHLIDPEVTQALRHYVLRGEMTPLRARRALDVYLDMPILRYPCTNLLPRIWALRQNLTAYDAAYVALAEALDAPLLTRDSRLARATGHRASVEFV